MTGLEPAKPRLSFQYVYQNSITSALCLVRTVRLELTHLSATASKTVAATNYATSA